MDNGQLELTEALKFRNIESMIEVAEALQLQPATVRNLAYAEKDWKGQMAKLCLKNDKEDESTDPFYFFPAGTIAANRKKFTRRKKRPHSTEMDELRAENKCLKKLVLRLESVEMRIKNGGLLPADGEEGEGF